MTVDRLPPHDVDAEEATVASILLEGGMNGVVLVPSDFYSETCRITFQACREVSDRNEKINQITVAQELGRLGKLEAVGGVAFLSHLIATMPTSLDLEHYANIVQRLSIARQLVSAGGQISNLGFRADPDPGKALGEADDLILDIRKRTVGSPIVGPEERVEGLMARYDSLFKQEAGIAVKTGMHTLDARLGGGLYPGDLTLVAARAGLGKTTFLRTVANNVGKSSNVLFCTVEMNWQSMSDRDMAGILKVPVATIRLGAYEDKVYTDLLGPGLTELSKSKVYYFDDLPLTASKVMRAGMEMKLRRGLSLVVIDYLGVMDDEYGRSPYERMGFISRKVKQVARTLDVPVLAAQNLSRGLESRNDKTPQLHDLRDSGTLEEDADVVIFLYRDNYYDMSIEDTTTKVLIAKHRQGGVGVLNVMFDRERQCYRGMARDER